MTINAISAVIPTAQGRTNLNNNVQNTVSFKAKLPEISATRVQAMRDEAAKFIYSSPLVRANSDTRAIGGFGVGVGLLTALFSAITPLFQMNNGIVSLFLCGTTFSTFGHIRLRNHGKIFAQVLKEKGFSMEERVVGVREFFLHQRNYIDKLFITNGTIMKIARAGENVTGNALAAAA